MIRMCSPRLLPDSDSTWWVQSLRSTPAGYRIPPTGHVDLMPPISLVETSSDPHCDLKFFLLSPSSSPDPPSDISELHPGMKAPPALSCLLPLILHRHCCWCLVAKSCPTLCDPTDCSPPGSSVHGISQARVLEWVAIPFCRGSSHPRDQTCIWILYHWATREVFHRHFPYINHLHIKTCFGIYFSENLTQQPKHPWPLLPPQSLMALIQVGILLLWSRAGGGQLPPSGQIRLVASFCK